MPRGYPNPLHNPRHYATLQQGSEPPATYGAARRLLRGCDYIIVRARAAGCVLASKLSENQNVSVLLLEAGGDNPKVFETKVPLMNVKSFHTENDWNYYTVEQPGLASRRLYWPRGKGVYVEKTLHSEVPAFSKRKQPTL